ncbi:hypothetical protein [Aquimarina algiphila]|uniref:hypothetical protein n=1 Tax=Aquimarina algiphila TaxID=2047982 RepID=UPI00232B4D2E|nr:hypothetical protein [Aquimarina algiphila]
MTRLLFLVLIFFIKTSLAFSQENYSWILGLGINTVDNSGSRFDELLEIENNWNISRLAKATLEKRFEYDYGLEVGFSINKFSGGKTINSEINQESLEYFAIDLMVKNYISNYWLWGCDCNNPWYNLYITGGWGGNFFNGGINNTLNIGFGMNIKLGIYMWLNFQTLGKFSIDNNTPGNANHLQHSISLQFLLY